MSVCTDISSSTDPTVRNVKIHFYVRNVPLLKHAFSLLEENIATTESNTIRIRRCGNFYVLRKKFVYTIFLNSGYINATKIPNYTVIDDCKEEITNLLNLIPEDISEITIDNTTYVGNLNRRINPLAIQREARKRLIRVSYNPNWFSAVYLRFPKGTINLFHTGKYMIVGAKEHTHISDLTEKLEKVVDDALCE